MTDKKKTEPRQQPDKPREGLPTGEKTSGKDDVADPHPSQEEGYGRKSQKPMTGL